jgi:polyphosphate kinase
MADVNRIFHYLEQPKTRIRFLRSCKTLLVSPVNMRKQLVQLITREIRNAKSKKPAAITLKLNSLSDESLIDKLYEAAKAGLK